MPRSKRFQKKSLTQTNKKGLALKQRLIEQIRSCAEKYDRIFTFSVKNMRNIHLKDVRGKMADSRFFFGKNKVMVLALGKGPEDEHLDGLHQLASHIRGQTGLLFTNKKKAHVCKFFEDYKVADYARSGDVATETVVLEAGPVKMDLCHSMEPQLRQLGLPTSLVRGVITLTQEYQVCKKGDKITPEKGRILKLFGYQMAEFSIRPTGMWTKEKGTWESFGKSKTDDAENMDTDEEGEEDDDEEEEEEDDIADT